MGILYQSNRTLIITKHLYYLAIRIDTLWHSQVPKNLSRPLALLSIHSLGDILSLGSSYKDRVLLL